MKLLEVRELTKRYEAFTLDRVSFSLEEGYIMGFIGRNGAGKTTTLKSMLNLVHPDGGQVDMFGQNYLAHEFDCKQKVGFLLGGVDYYPKKKLKDIADVTKRFYTAWDDRVFAEYMDRFELDKGKRVEQLSAGMRVKFGLALALSHDARLLLLDEPTSGLDPVSRDEIVELFQRIVEDGGHSILFSTHITSDLEKCADYITYIRGGKLLMSTDKDSFLDAFRLVQGRKDQLTDGVRALLIGHKDHAFGFTGLIHSGDLQKCPELEAAPADLESIMIYSDKEA